ncbi:MAG: cobamide remodeling phosphodiesterase CbiR [Thermodesulfobacteriota bacterium]
MTRPISNERNTYDSLAKSYRGTFPFTIGATSYIYPDHILPNVRMLMADLEEIELVLYESTHPPTGNEIAALANIGNQHGLRYNVHLPIDIFLGDPDPAVRRYGTTVAAKIIALTKQIKPSTYTLHFSLKSPDGFYYPDISQWRKNLSKSMEEILNTDVAPRQISIENLEYPLEQAEEVIQTFDLSVCLDIGHLVLYRRSLIDYAKRYMERAAIFHLHGVKDSRAHISLDALSKKQMKTISLILETFRGTVSIEVFSFGDLKTSLERMERYCK